MRILSNHAQSQVAGISITCLTWENRHDAPLLLILGSCPALLSVYLCYLLWLKLASFRAAHKTVTDELRGTMQHNQTVELQGIAARTDDLRPGIIAHNG